MLKIVTSVSETKGSDQLLSSSKGRVLNVQRATMIVIIIINYITTTSPLDLEPVQHSGFAFLTSMEAGVALCTTTVCNKMFSR